MGKKDKKSKTAEQKARVAAKQTKKVAQKDKKMKTKVSEDSDADDVDLESVLEEYARKVSCHSCYNYNRIFGAAKDKLVEQTEVLTVGSTLDLKLTLGSTASPISQSYRDDL